ncbi:MAG: SGNH/GDSL hydrolase family protein [Planctomycetota bacterium]
MNFRRFVPCLVLPVLLTGPGSLLGQEESAGPETTIAVLGSSVAAGWVTSYEAKHDLQNGYAARLGRLLEDRGFKLVNVSIPGNTTSDVLARMNRDLEPLAPDIVLIGLSLANEGLEDDRDAAVETYLKNLPEIVDRCNEAGWIPVVGLCYPYDGYDATDYAALKQVNLAIEGFDVATINLLGALDDGTGQFVEGYTYDEGHPDNRGHDEMFLSIVPSLFESLLDGVPAPARPGDDGCSQVAGGSGHSAFVYVPEDVVHSFSLGFSIRTKESGAVAAVHADTGPLLVSIVTKGCLNVKSSQEGAVTGQPQLTDGTWHDILLCHRYLQGKLLVFVDGAFAGEPGPEYRGRPLRAGHAGAGAGEPRGEDRSGPGRTRE